MYFASEPLKSGLRGVFIPVRCLCPQSAALSSDVGADPQRGRDSCRMGGRGEQGGGRAEGHPRERARGTGRVPSPLEEF